MSPLVAAPNRGYGDWQRVNNYDTAPIFSNNVAIVGAELKSPIVDVSRFAYLAGLVSSGNSNNFRLEITWFADAAGTIALGTREMSFDIAMVNPAQLRLPNLGPFAQLVFVPFGPAMLPDCVIIATNRDHPLELIPTRSVLTSQQSINIAATSNLFIAGDDYYSGPARLWLTFTTIVGVQIRSLDRINSYELVYQHDNVPALTNLIDTVIIPPGAWQLVLTNSASSVSNGFAVLAQPNTGAT